MSALPQKLVPMPKQRQVSGIKSQTVELSPTNGSLTTTYNPLDRLIFQIPSYPNGFLDVSKSYLRFKPTLTPETAGQVAFDLGLPLFERIIVKSGSGAILEDIQDVDLLENLLEGAKEKSSGSARQALSGDGLLVLTERYTRQNNKNIVKRLPGGVFGEDQEFYLPLHLMGGPYALEVELVLNDRVRALQSSTAGSAYTYSITNVVFCLEIVNMSEEVCKKLDAAICGGEALSIPMSTYRSYRNVISAGVTNTSLQVHEVSPNVEQVWLALQKSTKTYNTQKLLEGGSEAVASNKVDEYQFRYADRYMPLQPAKDLAAGSSQALINMINATHVENPSVCVPSSGVAPYFVDRFFIVQDMQTDKGLISGLSTQAHAGPIETFLKFSTATADQLTATHFTKTSHNIAVSRDGITGLGMVM